MYYVYILGVGPKVSRGKLITTESVDLREIRGSVGGYFSTKTFVFLDFCMYTANVYEEMDIKTASGSNMRHRVTRSLV